MTVFIASFLFVVLAEMGDKTQLLAMAFATRFPAKTVLAGVLVATLFNHLLAVVLGSWLTNIVPLDGIQIAASASFILFGLWTLRGDKLEGEDKKYKFSPFWTVAVAFFLRRWATRRSSRPWPSPRSTIRSSPSGWGRQRA